MSSLVNNLIVPGPNGDVPKASNGSVIQVAAREQDNITKNLVGYRMQWAANTNGRERSALRPLASGGGSMCLELTVTGEETPAPFLSFPSHSSSFLYAPLSMPTASYPHSATATATTPTPTTKTKTKTTMKSITPSTTTDITTAAAAASTVHIGYSFEVIEESARYLLTKTRHRPKIGVICGSGLGGLAEQLEDSDEFPYETIPNFPVSTVVGHAGRMVIGLLNGVPVLCMQGRFHAYEGYPLWKCAMPVRVMKVMGVEQLVVTNAAGGLNANYNVGDIMIIKDHINMQGFAGDSPLRGKNDERFGPRFPAMNNAYDRTLRRRAGQIAVDMSLDDVVREGVYVMLGGPTYETVAELNLLRILGVDAVGMSTVPEVVVARHCGMRVFAFSLITNKCITEYDTEAEANHEEVIEVANKRKKDLQELAQRVIGVMAEDTEKDDEDSKVDTDLSC